MITSSAPQNSNTTFIYVVLGLLFSVAKPGCISIKTVTKDDYKKVIIK